LILILSKWTKKSGVLPVRSTVDASPAIAVGIITLLLSS